MITDFERRKEFISSLVQSDTESSCDNSRYEAMPAFEFEIAREPENRVYVQCDIGFWTPQNELVAVEAKSHEDYDIDLSFFWNLLICPQLSSDPLAHCRNLKNNWDDRGAYPLSKATLENAELFYKLLDPAHSAATEISPAPGDFVEFLWRKPEDGTRLEVWVYGSPDECHEFGIYKGEEVLNEGSLESLDELVAVVRSYLS